MYLAWGNKNGLGVGNDFGAFCCKCMGEYDKRGCFVRELEENEINFEREAIPYFLKKKLIDKKIKNKIMSQKYIEEFNDKFQEFEKLLKKFTKHKDETHFRDTLSAGAQKNSFLSDNFGLCEDLYALRNVFSHRKRGKYIATIEKQTLKDLDEIIKNIKNPPTVLEKFGINIFDSIERDKIIDIMEEMEAKTYTHVPLWDNDRKKLIGVFSYTSLFSWLSFAIKGENNEINFNKKYMSDISPKYLNSPSVNFDFISENKSVHEVMPIFKERKKARKRLDCLLITPKGKRNEKIKGIITPWDLGNIN